VEVVLSHVCSEWRSTAINLTTLWTAFKFDTHLCVSDPFKKLEEYLSRSGTQLLELYFSFSLLDYNDSVLDICNSFECDFALVETAIAHAFRWSRFTLLADEFIGAFEFIDRFDNIYAPNLEYLALCLSSHTYPWSIAKIQHRENIDTHPLILTGGAPRLYAVRIDALTPFRSPSAFSNITTLAIQGSPDDELYFQLQDFHSILTIPTLTNLSIETWRCLDPYLTDNPEYLPSIKMPSLKTLRITQDSGILSILSLIDAPLLETLILHNVDLISVYFYQDIHKIATFIRLDTIALLDCRYELYDSEEDVDIVDMILHTIACRATHVIISSPGGPSFIEEGSKLLDFNRYEWPRLQCLTLDLSTFTFAGPMFSIGNFERSPHSLTVRVVKQVLDYWKGRGRQCDGLMTLEKPRKLETMQVGDLMTDEPWPAPGGSFQEDGNLENRFTWGETLRAKGSDWLWKSGVSQPFLLVWY